MGKQNHIVKDSIIGLRPRLSQEKERCTVSVGPKRDPQVEELAVSSSNLYVFGNFCSAQVTFGISPY